MPSDTVPAKYEDISDFGTHVSEVDKQNEENSHVYDLPKNLTENREVGIETIIECQ